MFNIFNTVEKQFEICDKFENPGDCSKCDSSTNQCLNTLNLKEISLCEYFGKEGIDNNLQYNINNNIDAFINLNLKQNKSKNEDENEDEDEDSTKNYKYENDINNDTLSIISTQSENSDNNKDDKINSDDEDEDIDERFYIISINDIPYFYEKHLKNARDKMWKMANKFLKDSINVNYPTKNFLISTNINSVQVKKPYQFVIFNYEDILYDFKIDYVIPYSL